MNDQQAFNFLDKLTMISVALQMNDHINNINRRDIIAINRKLDRLLQLVEGNSTDADKHP